MNYNDIDNETREKILNHKSFLSVKVNAENTNFKDIALTFSKVCYSIIKINKVSAVLIGEINLLISNSRYLFEMNEYIKNNKYLLFEIRRLISPIKTADTLFIFIIE